MFKNFFLKLFPQILMSASLIIVSTGVEKNTEIRRLSETLVKKTFVIPNGLRIDQIAQSKMNYELRSKLGLKPDDKMIVYFGRIQFIKGLDISLEALSLIKDIPYKFVIIGRDEGMISSLTGLSEKLQIKDRVIFIGPLFGKDLAIYLASADLFLFNSRSESLPMAVLDSCAAGLPVIISPYCNLPEVESFGAGMVLKNNTPEDTAKAIRQYFIQPRRQDIMRQECHELIINHFNLEKISKQYFSIYDQVVSDSLSI